METPTLVVSDPPHEEVDLDAAAKLLSLDTFATGLKAGFVAPEIMLVADPDEAWSFAAALGRTGFSLAIMPGSVLTELPWPEPLSSLSLDASCLRGVVRDEAVEIPYDTEVVGVYCRPPADRWLKPPVDPVRAVASGHGPTIADAIQHSAVLDLYFREDGALRRITLLPALLDVDAERVVKDIGNRLKRMRLDSRLAGVRPRAPFVPGEGFDKSDRRRYSFGTLLLRSSLESISTELGTVPQYELGSRLSYALRPIEETSS